MYKSIGPKTLENIAKQQFIYVVRNNVMSETLIVNRFKNFKKQLNTNVFLK